MKEEYIYDMYSSIGKKYNGEKAIISLTSWKARINTVGKTIFNLYKMCPGFHIVLCLSEEEFPKKKEELPEDLMLMANTNIFEILWVYKNYKAFKKVLFTMDKYRDVPIISADDDCIYTCNYAEILYNEWTKHKNCIITNNGNHNNELYWSQGPNTIFPPKSIISAIKFLNDDIIKLNNDDAFYGIIYKKLNIKMVELHFKNWFYFHDEIEPQYLERKKHKGFFSILEIYQKILK